MLDYHTLLSNKGSKEKVCNILYHKYLKYSENNVVLEKLGVYNRNNLNSILHKLKTMKFIQQR